MSIVVDLPAPLGPSSATVSPASIDDVDAAHGVHRAVALAQPRDLDRAHLPRLYARRLHPLSLPQLDLAHAHAQRA